ncbi:MAG: CRISPR-associated helicase Cas3' [Hyphomicrobiales bacterium]|nr:CRISPR-associated helicase Cas3' [Hyphomicrobiales bacterium]
MPFWGKSFIDEHGVHQTHPLVFHCLDVAAVADALLCEFPERRLFLARLLNVEPGVAHGFIVRLIALHDIGKFHPGFQGKLPGYCEQHLPHLAPHIRPGAKRHDLLGFLISQEIGLLGHFQEQLLDWQVTDFDTVFRAIAFHHGAPGDCDSNDNTWCKSVGLIEPAMLAFIEDIKAIIPCPGLLPFHSAGKLGIFSWALAGLTVLADWIGSNSEIFTFPQPNALALHEYWPLARERADRAVHEAGILSALPAILRDPVELLPTPRGSEAKAPQASPLQRAAFEAVFTDGPQLFIIEDMTGAGKTEAALILASRLLSEGRAAGLYFALPTMATANAMYDRMATIYRRLFAENEMPSLVLAHGRRAMNDGFTASIFDGMARATPGAGDEAEPSEAACAAWIADDRRKSFFAHIGAGTIDQALLSVLPSRHQSLRLWGLADRVLIVDEAHCYDPYVNRELERLIEFHTALGGSTIILSATLAMTERRRLAAAFAKGAGASAPHISSPDYPLLTAISASHVAERALESRAELRRTLPVKRLASFDEAVEAVAKAARAGACVAWIRNAVDDAIEACAALEAVGLAPLLLHARFAMGDRIEKEREIAQRLGRDSAPENRRGLIIVGTQILEQSLDYDVDAMITDLAPIDLVIQRAGRLWRHPNRAGRPLEAAELLVFSPDPDDVRDENWYASMSKRAAGVYKDNRIVWKSAKALFDAACIETPSKVRHLISQVYDDDERAVPDPIERASKNADGTLYTHISIAEMNLLKLNGGYGGNNQIWTDDRKISTRLEEEPSTVFRLGRVVNGVIQPWCSEEQAASGVDKRQAWALSEVSIQQRRASGVPSAVGALMQLVIAAKADWGKWEQDIPLLVLEENGATWQGRVTSKEGERTAHYDIGLGLRILDA